MITTNQRSHFVFLLTLFWLTQVLVGCLLTSHAVAQSPLANVVKLLDEEVKNGNAAGLIHLVVKDGETIFQHTAGVRDIKSREPIQPDTIVRIYSMTKPITSVAAMTLFEQGKFQLDDPIEKFIPEFADVQVAGSDGDLQKPKRSITVRDCLRHTTGYAYGGNGKPLLEKSYARAKMKYHGPLATLPPEMTIEKAAKELLGIPLLHHPGERFTYGFSTDLLGRLIEVWSDKPLAEYISESVLMPLEMSDTAFVVAKQNHDRFASCHTHRDGTLAVLDSASTSPFIRGFDFTSGGGGLTSTAVDYAKFCEMLVGNGSRGDVQVLKPETLELMFTDQLKDVDGDFQFGLGFAIHTIEIGKSKRKAQQYSWGGYASTDFRVVPEEKLFQIFIRQHVPSKHELARRAFDMVYESAIESTSTKKTQ